MEVNVLQDAAGGQQNVTGEVVTEEEVSGHDTDKRDTTGKGARAASVEELRVGAVKVAEYGEGGKMDWRGLKYERSDKGKRREEGRERF
jgi:hypothetical protein